MLLQSFGLLLLAASCTADGYPRYDFVFRDPRSFDLLYGAASGPINETWYLGRAINLTAVILPAQTANYHTACGGSEGVWNKGTYSESISVRVFETNMKTSATELVGFGSFEGNVTTGQELHVPIGWAQAPDEPPTLSVYGNSNSGHRYIVSITFGTTGLYPWYNSRPFSLLSPFTSQGSAAGFIIGFSYVVL